MLMPVSWEEWVGGLTSIPFWPGMPLSVYLLRDPFGSGTFTPLLSDPLPLVLASGWDLATHQAITSPALICPVPEATGQGDREVCGSPTASSLGFLRMHGGEWGRQCVCGGVFSRLKGALLSFSLFMS